MNKLFTAASLAFASIPGVSVMLSGMGTPPGYATLFGGVIQAFGALAILLLYINREKLKRISGSRVTTVVVLLASVSLCCMIFYLQLLGLCVVTHPVHGTVYYPLWNSGHALEMVNRAGGRYAAIDHYGSYPITKAIHEASNGGLPIIVTTALLLFVYEGIFTTLALAFGIIGMRESTGSGAATLYTNDHQQDTLHSKPTKARAAKA